MGIHHRLRRLAAVTLLAALVLGAGCKEQRRSDEASIEKAKERRKERRAKEKRRLVQLEQAVDALCACGDQACRDGVEKRGSALVAHYDDVEDRPERVRQALSRHEACENDWLRKKYTLEEDGDLDWSPPDDDGDLELDDLLDDDDLDGDETEGAL